MFTHMMEQVEPTKVPTANVGTDYGRKYSNPDPDHGRDKVDVRVLASKMEILGVDPTYEEKQLQATIGGLVAFAKEQANPVSELSLANTTLPLSSTAWQVLVSERPAEENSFRGELFGVLQQSVGLVAAMQEELALYNVRQSTSHLFKKHLCSLFFLAHKASIFLPQLQRVSQLARSRGLKAKAEHLDDTIRRMDDLVQHIAKLNPAETAHESKVIRCDPKWQEACLQEATNQLVAFAKSVEKPVSCIPLPNSELAVSPTEWQALATASPSEERSFRADLHRVLRRTTGLRAGIQEELAHYRSRKGLPYQWKKHVESLQYLSDSANQILPELEGLSEESKRRNLSSKYADLQLLIARVREQLEQVATLQ